IHSQFKEMLHSGSDAWYWVVRDSKTNAFIGLISLDEHHSGKDIEISYQLAPRWWGAGYGTEAVGKIMSFAFSILKMPRIVAETQAANVPSRKLLEKLGMEKIDAFERFGAEQVLY